MALYVAICIDKPNSLDLRLATRPTHREYLAGKPWNKGGGPFLDEKGDMNGTLLMIEADSLEEAEGYSAADPYRQAGLFQSVDIRRWQAVTHPA